MKKIAVISGVTSGVGKALVNRFTELDWQVVGLSRTKNRLLELEDTLGPDFLGLQVDVQSENDVSKVLDHIKNSFHKIDLLVNNAAIFKMEEFIKCSFADINTIIDTNLKGVMYLTLKAIKIMKHSDTSGRIINIGSVASVHGIENQAIYCASKFGLNGFAEALNQEIIKYNISISTIFPGGINTPLWNESNPYPGGDVKNILQCSDIVKIVEYISELEPRVVLKNLTIFPSNEWH
ncbi:MAG: SDR family oxidoreductase [Desulfobulbaceae bacterium]|nr:SDR family oxidoreductase [Desulfobulbaceae bacterium]